MVQHMKACEQGFHMRQILWQNASCLQSNGLLSATLKTGKFTGKMVVLVVADGPPLLTDAMLVDQDASIPLIPLPSGDYTMQNEPPPRRPRGPKGKKGPNQES